MKDIERALKRMDQGVKRHVSNALVSRFQFNDFNDLEKSLLRFLKDEFLEKGSSPAHMTAPATLHRDVMDRFNLTLPQYRAVIARLESLGIVEAPTIEAHNGCLRISSGIVDVVRQLDEEDSPVAAEDFLQRLMAEHGEEFAVVRSDAVRPNARGLRNQETTGQDYIGFLPGTDVQVGDSLLGAVSGDRLRVIDTGTDLTHGKVLQIKAFTISEAAYQQRIAQSGTSSINIGTMTNSAIQQNSPAAVQNVTFTQANRNDVEDIVTAIASSIDQLGLGEEDKADLLADVETIKAQLKKTSPSPSLVRSCLEGLRTGIGKAATSAVSAGAAAVAKELLAKLSAVMGG